MKSIKKIMVAVDFSEHSLASFHHAVKLAGDLGAQLLLVNVINQRDVDMIKLVADRIPDFSIQNYLKETVSDREESFQNLIKDLDCGDLNISNRVRIGHPYEELLKTIDKEKPDLLVMGVKGRSNLVETVIGSCAQKMFRRCPIPLLTIR
ncbi:MAG: universal stress protein [Desulfobacterales bacterium]|jgi:nucleotide-binding universal stress UspA family protein